MSEVNGQPVATAKERATTLYRFYDAGGQLLYIGISLAMTQRLHDHRQEKSWWGEIASAKFEHYRSLRDALVAEANAIRSEKPLHNIAHNQGGTPEYPTTRFGLAPGFWVALLLKEGTAPLRCYVGEVQTVDTLGVRITLVDWFIGSAVSWDFFAPWDSITGALVATPDHTMEYFLDSAAKWQTRMDPEEKK